jgi:uncharacterized small protein (DUF1192 family)
MRMDASFADLEMNRQQLQRIECFVRETETRISHLQSVVSRLAAQGQTPEAAQLAVEALQSALEAVRECKGLTGHMIDGLRFDGL